MDAALHLDYGVADVAVVDADGLQYERREREVSPDVRECQVHQLLIDLDPLDVHAGVEGAGDAADVEPHTAEMVRDVTRDELKAALGVHRRPDEHRRHGDDQEHQDAGEDEEQAAHGAWSAYNFGEKLMCRRGPAPGMLSGCATSMPTVITGRRTRRPTPNE